MPLCTYDEEGRDGVTTVTFETYKERLFTFVRHHVDNQIGLLRRRQGEPTQRLWGLEWHPVECYNPAFPPARLKCEDPRILGVDTTKPHAGMARHLTRPVADAVHGDPIADPVCFGPVMHVVTAFGDLGLVREAPVVEQKHLVQVNLRCIGLFVDDKRPLKSPRHVLIVAVVGVVPIGACIREIEIVQEIASRFDGGLRHAPIAVHAIFDPDAVPGDA